VLVLGQYPELGLAEARERRNEARALLRQGRNPAIAREHGPSGPDFETVARDWHRRQAPGWRPNHAAAVLATLERDAFPKLSGLPIAAISSEAVLAMLRGMEARGAVALAHHVRQRVSAVFEFAIEAKLCSGNPVVRSKVLTRKVNAKRPAIVALPEFCAMLRRIEAEPALSVTQLALRLLALTGVRPGEVAGAEWSEFELDGPAPLWTIPASRMKGKEEHVVPLAPAAADIIRALKPVTGNCRHVFARDERRPIAFRALNDLVLRAGFRGLHCGHGFRASFATIMTKRHPADSGAIEAALAHTVPGTRGRYMREIFVDRRRELAQEWADLILAYAPSASELLTGRRC
jgi:integrase